MSSKRSRGVAAVGFSLVFITAACTKSPAPSGGPGAGDAGTPQRGGTLRILRHESFDGWNPDKAAAYASYQTLEALTEPLVRVAPDGKSLQPGIAESWTYDPKGPSWTFVIRQGVTFSDGTPLSSADVAFSEGVWEKGPNFGSLYGNIKEVRTPDSQTAVFDLAAPDTTLPVLMSWSSSGIFPKDFGGRSESDYFNHPVGAGAFTVAQWSPGGQIVLKRNDRYYIPNHPYVDEVVINVVADGNQAAVQFQSGQADISEYVSPADASQYGNSIVALPTSQVEHLSLNTTSAPLNDPAVRQAIAHAIDYAAIAGGPFRGYGSPPQGIIAPNLANWAPPSVPPFSKDIAAARQLLAGSKNPHPAPLELVYDSGLPDDGLVAQIVQSNLKAIGIDVKLTGLETGAFLGRAFGLSADMVLWSYGAISPDVIDPLGWILGTSWLFTGFETKTLGKQFSSYSATQSPQKKQEIITQIQDQALQNAQAIPLCDVQVLQAVSDKVHGFASAPWGLYYWDPIWLSG